MKKFLTFFLFIFVCEVNAQSFCFQQTGLYNPPMGPAQAVCNADFNNDGYLDVAITIANGTNGYVLIYIGQGNGTFTTGPYFPIGNQPWGLTADDFNNDGNQDIAAVNYNAGNFSILIGNGGLGFSINTFGCPGQPKSVRAADLNHDGNLDLAICHAGPGQVSTWLGTGAGIFNYVSSFTAGGAPYDVAIGDFNNDGNKDVIALNNGSSNVSYFMGFGNGGLAPQTTIGGPLSGPFNLCTFDYNLDGNLDFAAGGGGTNSIAIFTGNGNGTFNPFSTNSVGNSIRGVTAGDFNGDGKPDVACTSFGSNTVTFFAAPSFTPFTTISSIGNGTRWIDAGDFNNDGKPDVSVTANSSGQMIPLLNNAPFPITAVGSPTVICNGSSASLNAGGNYQAPGNTALTYNWSPSSSLNTSTGTYVIATPATTTTYTVLSSYSGCGIIASNTVMITVNPLPTVTVNSSAVCAGSTGTLTANGASTYNWSPATGLSSTSGATVFANPASTTVYTVSGTSSQGCVSSTTSTVTVNPLPIMTSANNKIICSGASINLALTASAASTFSWVTGNNPNTTGESTTTQTSSTISNTILNSINTAATLIYTVTPKASATGCVGPAQTVTITVNPVDAINPMSASVCSGTTFTVTPVNGTNGVVASPSTYSWTAPSVTGGVTGGASGSGSSIVGTLTNPSSVQQTATYTVTPTAFGSCTGTNFVLTVTVNPTPTMTSASTKTVCSGNSVNLTFTSGTASTFSWIATDNANTTGESTTTQVGSVLNNSLTSSSSSIQTVIYTVTPTSTTGSCVGTAQTVTVTIDNLPPVAAAGTDVSICTYSLNLGGNNASPGTGTWSLQSQSVPTFTTNGLPSNNNTALVWFTGINTGNSATLRWTINSQLGVCPATFDDIVITKANCPLAAAFVTSPTSHTLCIKPASTVTVSYTDNSSPGSNGPIASYSWTFNGGSPSSATGPGPHIVTYSYTSTQQSYNTSLTVVDQTSATSNSTQLITLNPYPSAAGTITGSATVCQGQNGVSYSVPTILNADNGYSWIFPAGVNATNPTNSASVDFSTIAQSGTIKVCGVNACGAGDTAYLPVTVNPLPAAAGPISGTTTVCQGTSSVSYSVASIANASSYLWLLPTGATTSSATNTASVNFSTSAVSGTIKVVGKNGCGAGDTSYLAITVNNIPNVIANATATVVCNGTAVTLNGSGASTYTWTGGVNDGASFTPSATATYTVTGTGANSCVNSTVVTVTVNPLPNVTANTTATAVCTGASATLTGGGASSYNWTGGVANGVSFVPSATSDYTVTGTDANLCVNTATVSIAVNSLPVVMGSASASVVCLNNSIVLTGSGASTYTWTGGASDGIAFTPTASATYTVTGADANSCSATAVVTVNVITPAIPSICLVTTDSMSVNNIIYWEKTGYSLVDSFIVYREVSTNTYKRIGAVSKDSLSMFIDTSRSVGAGMANGDPNIGYYHYKIQIRDSCGNYSPMSLYHTSVFFIDNQNGTFTWNSYDVEGQTTPVTTFDLNRDDNNTGAWNVIGSVAGTTSTLNDPSYSTYQSTGNWRVEANGFNCNPSLRTGHNSVATGIVRTKSNITNNRTTKITQANGNVVAIYPNPNNGTFTVENNEKGVLQVYSVTGELIMNRILENIKTEIDASALRAGVYTVCISNKSGILNTKLVIVK